MVSRPLKTGAAFTLVLPKKGSFYVHWDKEKYLAGDEGVLIFEGLGLGPGPFDFALEKSAGPDGPWTPVATLQAKLDGQKATATYKLPKAEQAQLYRFKVRAPDGRELIGSVAAVAASPSGGTSHR